MSELRTSVVHIASACMLTTLGASINPLPAFIQLNIDAKPEVNISLERVRHQSGHATGHEEVAGAANYRNVPSLVHQRVSPSKIQATLVVSGRKHKGKAKPSCENILLVIDIEPLGTPDRL